jgi:oxygen-independent coproporphyrinogen III oxidase
MRIALPLCEITSMAGIYIHVPFCKQACHYCDFHFSTNLQLTRQLSNAIAKELQHQKDYLKGDLVKTIYFGGGTPSLLPCEDLDTILTAVAKNFNIDDNPEITIEANPDDLTSKKLLDLHQL